MRFGSVRMHCISLLHEIYKRPSFKYKNCTCTFIYTIMPFEVTGNSKFTRWPIIIAIKWCEMKSEKKNVSWCVDEVYTILVIFLFFFLLLLLFQHGLVLSCLQCPLLLGCWVHCLHNVCSCGEFILHCWREGRVFSLMKKKLDQTLPL